MGSIVWYMPVFGFVSGLLTFLVGSLLILTVVGKSIGIGLIQVSKCLLVPHTNRIGTRTIKAPDGGRFMQVLEFILWLLYLPVGVVLALLTFVQITVLFLTVVGIPTALVLIRVLPGIINPVNITCVEVVVLPEEIHSYSEAA